MLAIFIAAAAAGPLILYGAGSLFAIIFEAFGRESVLVMALLFTVFSLGWLFFVLWVSNKANQKLGEELTRDVDADC